MTLTERSSQHTQKLPKIPPFQLEIIEDHSTEAKNGPGRYHNHLRTDEVGAVGGVEKRRKNPENIASKIVVARSNVDQKKAVVGGEIVAPVQWI